MNILMLTNTYTPHIGGVARSVVAFSGEFWRAGHRVLTVAPIFPGAPASEPHVVRIPAIQHFNGSDFSMPLPVPVSLRDAVREFSPDIVHSHHPFLLGDTALRISAERALPIVFTHHTQYERYGHYVPLPALLLRRFVVEMTVGYCNLCSAVVAPSESIASVLVQHGVTARIEVIPTGVDARRFAQGNGIDFRRRLGIPEQAFVVGHVGRLAPEKNLQFLTKAIAAFLEENLQAHFLLIGAGPMQDDIQTIFSRPSLRGRFHAAGVLNVPALIDGYHAMDVFAFASHSETQGMVLTEAMAAGVPVVALDASGVREVVRDRQNGRLLPAEDLGDFAGALAYMALLPASDRARLEQQCRQTAQTFSIGRTADQLLELYASSIHDHVRSAHRSGWNRLRRRVAKEWNIWTNMAHALGTAVASSAPLTQKSFTH